MPHLPELLIFLQVVLIDLSMAGDNALVVGMAAAGLRPAERHRAVLAGIAGATLLRILFAVFAVQILHLTGLLAAGGLLLLWVAWKMYEELRHAKKVRDADKDAAGDVASPGIQTKKISTAIWQIITADVSMSLDNVLGVAGVARDHLWLLAAGLSLSVLLMGIASSFVARLAARHSWIGYLGFVVILYTALRMVGDGVKPFLTP
jgi:YjbE family integral membrane protein